MASLQTAKLLQQFCVSIDFKIAMFCIKPYTVVQQNLPVAFISINKSDR